MKKLLLLSLFVTLLAAPVFAGEDNPNPSPWRDEETYKGQALNKLCFGAKNLFLGWTELVQEPIEQKSVTGVVQGVGNAVMDTFGGFLHLLTAPITTVDVPLPENGVSIWQKDDDPDLDSNDG